MMEQTFKNAAEYQGCSVNYVWICPRAASKHAVGCATQLPLHYFERIYENAGKYPDTEFNLWLDFRQLSISDRFFLDSHRYFFDMAEISIHDLREVKEYAESPGFDIDTNIALYARADYARILVLDHLLQKDSKTPAIYADIDCEDVKAEDPTLRETVEEYGLAYGRSGRHNIANGFIALQGEKGQNLMTHYLLPNTKTDFQKNKVNHFGAFARSVRKYRQENYPDLRLNTWSVVDLPLMRTLIPYNADRYKTVCPSGKSRIPGSLDFI